MSNDKVEPITISCSMSFSGMVKATEQISALRKVADRLKGDVNELRAAYAEQKSYARLGLEVIQLQNENDDVQRKECVKLKAEVVLLRKVAEAVVDYVSMRGYDINYHLDTKPIIGYHHERVHKALTKLTAAGYGVGE